MREQAPPAGRATAGDVDQVDIEADRALVERFQLGDETAFAELYSRHYRRLYRSCVRCLGDAATAEDAVQEAFTKALRGLPTLNGERRFYPWLSVIAKRVCVDIHRHRARSQPAECIDPGSTADEEQAVLASMDAIAVQDALARLTSRHRDVLHLREFEGWSYQRIAAHYGVRLAAVETLLWRARRALHRQLTTAGYERRALVSLPVVAWAYRRLGAIRARIDEIGGHRLVPVLGSAASVVTIGALVIGATGSGAHASRPQPVIGSHAAAVAPPALPSSAACPRRCTGPSRRPSRLYSAGLPRRANHRCRRPARPPQPDKLPPRGNLHQRRHGLAAGSPGTGPCQRRWPRRRCRSAEQPPQVWPVPPPPPSTMCEGASRDSSYSACRIHVVLMSLGFGSLSIDLAAPAGASTPPPVRDERQRKPLVLPRHRRDQLRLLPIQPARLDGPSGGGSASWYAVQAPWYAHGRPVNAIASFERRRRAPGGHAPSGCPPTTRRHHWPRLPPATAKAMFGSSKE